jgi:signal transduction histidine kinase
MSINSRTARFAYALHLLLSLLVIGALVWATNTSLRLERREQQLAAQSEIDNQLRTAIFHIESLLNPIFFRELQRPYADYVAVHPANTEIIRLATGEIFPPLSLVEPSPLMLDPPDEEWIVLHFQVTPLEGYSSPQLIPEPYRRWPDFAARFDLWPREPFAEWLARLESAYPPEDLFNLYDELNEYASEVVEVQVADAASDVGDGARRAPKRSEYARQRQRVLDALRSKIQSTECTSQEAAEFNLRATMAMTNAPLSNRANGSEGLVGITAEPMRPLWVELPGRDGPDLLLVRGVHGYGLRALQGILIDWPLLREELLKPVHYLFPKATLEPVLAHFAPPDDDVLAQIPARLVPHEQPVVAFTWSTTHTFLVVGWIVCLTLLVALSLGIRSLVTLFERRSQFAYAVTHELRTPLTTFRLYTDMLAQGLVPPEKQPEYLETLNNESRRLSDLVSSVLEYSRVENDSVPVNREPVRVATILEEVREAFGPRCASAGVKLQLDDCGLGDAELHTDRHHVVQILGNLVDNACKYGRSSNEPVIEVSAARENGSFHFDVADRGPGVPPRLRSAIFRPYRRGDSDSTPATGGIGLGLSLSRSWARLLGGSLELVPQPPGVRGARFRVRLPVGEP